MDQATANEHAGGGPGVVTLDGVSYFAAPATEKTFFAVRSYVKSQLKTPLAAVAAVFKDLPPAMRAEAIKEAVAQQPGGSEVTAEASTEILVSLSGCRFLAWLHMKPPLNPDLTRAKLDALITEDNYLDVFLQLDEATGVTKLAEEANSGNRSGRRS